MNVDTVIDYYTGFEGEPEIKFIRFVKNGDRTLLRIWYGYFYNIMTAVLNAIDPGANGWTGLAYCFSAVEGWYDESPWKIQDIQEALRQFNAVDVNMLDVKTKTVLNDICSLLANSEADNDTVWIEYD